MLNNTLKGRIVFVAILMAKDANPNGDPLLNNIPKQDTKGRSIISTDCTKRKLRNRLQDLGQPILDQQQGRETDGYKSPKERLEQNEKIKAVQKRKDKTESMLIQAVCKEWYDTRAFGKVIPSSKTTDNKTIGISGPITFMPCFSVSPVNIIVDQITKCVPGSEKGTTDHSDTIGTTMRVESAMYVLKGSINVQRAELTGFSEKDAEVFKQALLTLFTNDGSSARPAGSMEVCNLYWWKFKCPTPPVSIKDIHDSVHVSAKVINPIKYEDYEISVDQTKWDCVLEKYEMV